MMRLCSSSLRLQFSGTFPSFLDPEASYAREERLTSQAFEIQQGVVSVGRVQNDPCDGVALHCVPAPAANARGQREAGAAGG